MNVDRHANGEYICTASNGVGDPATASIFVEIQCRLTIITMKLSLEEKVSKIYQTHFNQEPYNDYTCPIKIPNF